MIKTNDKIMRDIREYLNANNNINSSIINSYNKGLITIKEFLNIAIAGEKINRKVTKISYTTSKGLLLSLSNLLKNCTIAEFKDVIYNGNTAEEIKRNLNKLDLRDTFEIDKETNQYIRLKSRDSWGNIQFLIIEY